MPDSPKVFLSYSTRDREAARAILTSLERAGIRCWTASRDIREGEVWEQAIIRGISSCQIVLCLLSAGANESRQVHREIHFACEENSKVVIPVRLENIRPTGALAYLLANLQWLEATSRPIDKDMSTIVERVQTVLAHCDESPVPAPPRITEPKSGNQAAFRNRRWFGRAILAGGAALFICLFSGFYYFRVPPSSLRVTTYTPITHDGRLKALAGINKSTLFYNERSPAAMQSLAIGNKSITPLNIPDAPEARIIFDVSPDGANVLVGSTESGANAHALWNASIQGKPLVRLGFSQGASFSPDGQLITSITPDGDLEIRRGDGSGADSRTITNVGRDAYRPAWSPDKRSIRFNRGNEIWEISIDGKNLHKLLPNWSASASGCCGRWTPDGRFFIFTSGSQERLGGQIWALDERPREFLTSPSPLPVQLTTGSQRWKSPIVSKDGKTLFAVESNESGGLCQLDTKAGQLQPFLKNIAAESVTFYGSEVGYVTFPDGILYKANQDGSNALRLSYPPMHPEAARWSPDGARIAFMDISPSVPQIFVISSDGGTARRILPTDTESERDPSWSSDSERIAFLSGKPRELGSEIRIFDLTNSQVTSVPASHGLWTPRWSPNGEYIAAITSEENRLKIYSLKERHWKTLVTNGKVDFPAWSSDSNWIYYMHSEKDQRSIFKLNINGGKPVLVANLDHTHLTGWWGQWMDLDPHDTPLLLVEKGGDEIYAFTLEER